MNGMVPHAHFSFMPPSSHDGQMQHTLSQPISSVGTGLHTGARISLRLSPAAENTGIVFHRTDCAMPPVTARYDTVVDTQLSTVLGHGPQGARIATVEHLMAALAGCGIDNVLVEVDGPEIPVFDGSAAEFVFLLECAGVRRQEARRKHIHVTRPAWVEEGDAFAELSPPRSRGLPLIFPSTFLLPP